MVSAPTEPISRSGPHPALLCALLVSLLVVGCGGGPPPEPLAVDVLATPDGRFEPVEVSAPQGTEITFNLLNETAIEHDIIVVSEVFELESELNRALADDSGLRLAGSELISPGEAASIVYAFDESGEYQYFCSVPNHFALGMRGTITISS
jgi:uncharacterized cupredoxin-like copper-binding protein